VSASIKSIFLEDFQSHARTKIELAGPGGVTIIVGPTDSGKTAIVRALRLLLYNVPQGTEYIRVGRNMATVAVELADGTKVVRERSKSVNRYRIVRPDEHPQVFEGFGLSVPLEVQAATGVRAVTIGDSLELALNLSEQLDGPFLGKSVSGPAKAKILGALAGTEEVDEAQRQLGTDLFRASQEEKRLLNEIEALDTKIHEYDYLPALSEKITSLEALLQAVREAQDRLAKLEFASQKLAGVQSQRAQALNVLARWKDLREAEFCVVVAEGDQIRLNNAVSHRVTLVRIATDREAWMRLLTRWVNLPAAEALSKEADSAHSRLQTLRSAYETLVGTRAGLERVAATLQRWAKLPEVSDSIAEASTNIGRLQALTALKSRYSTINEQFYQATEIRVRWAGLEAAETKVTVIGATSERLVTLSRIASTLISLREAKVAAENTFAQHFKALADTRKQYTDALLALGKCPVCGSQVNPDLIKEVA